MKRSFIHPEKSTIKASIGFDRAIGWFAEIRDEGKLVEEYDNLIAPESTVKGILDLLIKYDFFTKWDLSEALSLIPHLDEDECENPPPEVFENDGERLAATAVLFLKQAADPPE